MTVADLNSLVVIERSIERLIKIIEYNRIEEDVFFLDIGVVAPDEKLKEVCRHELPDLIKEYQRITAYIQNIDDPWMKNVFVMRYIDKKSLRSIGTAVGIASGTLKQEIYSYVRLHPEGYLTSRQLADRWSVNVNTINAYCRNGRIIGAKKWGEKRLWLIPDDAVRPKRLAERTRSVIPNGFLTTADLAERLGLTAGYIAGRCKRGDYPGAKQIQRKTWIIPDEYGRK